MGIVVAIFAIGLTSYRLSRLIARDSFPPLAVQRARIADRWGNDSWQAYLSECQWCVGVYVSGASTLAAALLTDVAYPVLVWASAATVVGVLATVVEAFDKVAEAADLHGRAIRKQNGV